MATQVREKSARNDAFISEQLARASQRIRLIDLATAGGVWLAGTLAYAILLMALDRAFILAAATRQTLFLAYLAASAAYLFSFVVRPLRWRVNPYFAARRLEQTLPDSRNHVINWIDLHDEKVPGVIRTALGQRAAKYLEEADVDEAISSRRAVFVGSLTGALLGVLLVLFMLFGPGPFRSLFARAFVPFGGNRIATRTQVRILRPEGGDAVVNIGNPVTVVAAVTGRTPSAHDKDAPCLLYRHDESEPYRKRFLQHESGEQWVTTVGPLDVGNGFVYKVTAGDGETPEYRVTARAAPLIADFVATYNYRPYVQRAARSKTTRKLEDLRGTEVYILARTNRTIKDGRLDYERSGAIGDLVRAEVSPDDPQALRFRLTLDHPGKYRIRFTSTDGELYLDPIAHEIVVLPDHAPEVKLTVPGKDVSVPANGQFELAGEASDDIGIAAVNLRLQVVGGGPLAHVPYLADKLGKRDFGTPRRIEYRSLLELGALRNAEAQPYAPRPGTQLEYWLEAADACDFPKPNVGVSERFKITITDPKNDEQQKKEKDAARQKQQKHEQEQAEQLKKEKQERDNQRQKEQEQEQKDAKDREQKKGDKGEAKPNDQGDGKKEEGKKDEPQNGEKGGNQQDGNERNKDRETEKAADNLKNALEKREKEQGKNDREKGKDDENAENKPGEARGDNANKPGENKDAGKKPENGEQKPGAGKDGGKPDDKGGEKKDGGDKGGDAKPGEGKDAGKPDAKDDKGAGKEGGKQEQPGQPKPGEGKPGEKPQPKQGENKPAGNPQNAANAGEKKPESDPKPGDKVRQGEAKDSKTAGKPTGEERPAEKKEGAQPGGEKKGYGKPGDDKDARPMNDPPPAQNKPGEKDAAPKNGKPGEGKDSPNGGKPGADGNMPGEGKGQGDPKDATKGDVDQLAKVMKNAGGQGREQAKRDLQDIARQANDPAARDAAKQALEDAEKGEQPGAGKPMGDEKGQPGEKKPGEGEGGAEGKGKPMGDDGMGNGKQGQPTGKDGPGKAKDGNAPGKSKGKDNGKAESPGEGLEGDRTAASGAGGGDAQKSRPEKAAKHRASTLQLEEFRKKVNRDVLKDAKMSKEQFERFLKDYAELAKRQQAADEERDTPPPAGRSGTLPSVGGKAIKPIGKSTDDVKSEGRPKPPPEYREAHENFLKRLMMPAK